ncbi:GNAT family N-acetyltransferase [bacterium]|nr:GNAT family N-acetyltransferase [bacterium]
MTDIPALVEFQREGWFEDYREIIPAGYAEVAMGLYGTTDALHRQIETDNLYLVVEDAGAVVACATAEILNDDEAELWWIHTTKSCRGCGIGRQLVDEIKHQLTGKVPTLCVTTFQDYTPTLAFYKRLGFSIQKTYIYEAQGFSIPEVQLFKSIA